MILRKYIKWYHEILRNYNITNLNTTKISKRCVFGRVTLTVEGWLKVCSNLTVFGPGTMHVFCTDTIRNPTISLVESWNRVKQFAYRGRISNKRPGVLNLTRFVQSKLHKNKEIPQTMTKISTVLKFARIHQHAKYLAIFSMHSLKNYQKSQILSVPICRNCAKIREIKSPQPKSNQFWRWLDLLPFL